MKSSASLVEELLEKPDVMLLMEQVNAQLQKEQEKRKEYRELIHEDLKAEFINGQILYHSPVKRRHWKVSMNLSIIIGSYVKAHDPGDVGVEKVMIEMTRNDYEPDIVFFKAEKAQHFTPEQMIFPPPDFVVKPGLCIRLSITGLNHFKINDLPQAFSSP